MILKRSKVKIIKMNSIFWRCYYCDAAANCTYLGAHGIRKKVSKKLVSHFESEIDPLIILDSQSKLTHVNPKFIELVGATSKKEFYKNYRYIFESIRNDEENFKYFQDIAKNFHGKVLYCLPLKIKIID